MFPGQKEVAMEFGEGIVEWFRANARSIPWRESHDPYAIWISEVMLQQTPVSKVVPFYRAWMDLFPSLDTLAQAPLEDVLKAWEGLGYYQRARRVWDGARLMVKKHGGKVPCRFKALLTIPGIGGYTAAAIMSLAFNEPYPVVDGNVKRVVSRILDLQEPIERKKTVETISAFVASSIPQGQSRSFAEGTMDFGAMMCRPRSALCVECPFASSCRANLRGTVASRPVKKRDLPKTPLNRIALVIQDAMGRVLIQKRREHGAFSGLWEFPGETVVQGETEKDTVHRWIRKRWGHELAVGEKLGQVRYVFTRYHVRVGVFRCDARVKEGYAIPMSEGRGSWVRPDRLDDYPMPAGSRKIAEMIRGAWKGIST